MKVKICFVVSSIFTARSFLKDHFTALSNDFDVYLVGNFSETDEKILNELGLAGYKTITINRNINLLNDLKGLFVLKGYLVDNKFVSVHSVTPKAGLIAALAGYLAKVPVRIHIFTGQVWHTKSGLFKRLLMMLDKVISKLNTHILVDGNSQREYLIQNRIIKRESSFVLGKGSISGVNVDRFNPCIDIRVEQRNELDISGKVVFGFLGRLNRDKGILDLFKAFDKLANENKSVFLLLIGSDEGNILSMLPEYTNIVDGENFKFYGVTREPERVLQALDVFCLPSYREGFGTSVLEASCLGIPVICSDTYGLMDAMIDQETGLRHRVGDSDDLYQRMKFMVENCEKRKAMGTNARKFVLENFSGAQITQAWVDFYKDITVDK